MYVYFFNSRSILDPGLSLEQWSSDQMTNIDLFLCYKKHHFINVLLKVAPLLKTDTYIQLLPYFI